MASSCSAGFSEFLGLPVKRDPTEFCANPMCPGIVWHELLGDPKIVVYRHLRIANKLLHAFYNFKWDSDFGNLESIFHLSPKWMLIHYSTG